MPYLNQSYDSVIERSLGSIKERIYTKVSELDVTAYRTKEPVPFAVRESGECLNLKIGQKWGELWDCAWFHFCGTVPENCKGKTVVAVIDVNGEACIFDKTGCPVQGLTCVKSEFDSTYGMPGKRIYRMFESAAGGEKVDLWADAGCNDLFGKLVMNGTLGEAHIAVCNNKLRELYYDIQVLRDLYISLNDNSARHNSILFGLYKAVNLLKNYDDQEIERVNSIIKPLLEKKCGSTSMQFSCIGHAHIDLAWLWPIRETKRKAARTFSTAIKLMERYPDYIFGSSQPQMYEWVKQDYPALYEKIRQKVKEGRWELQGAMWVEADTNLSGGESLVRQLLYGKKFFKDEFGVEVENLWLPDVFGYTASLPQILKKANVKYFMTQKLSWNEYNRFPHQSFLWKGIDGSEILTHMLPEETYNAPYTAGMLRKGEQNYIDSGICDCALSLFGIGDGGGGPGPEHLERASRIKDLADVPYSRIEKSDTFFKKLDKYRDRLKKWKGELYLEKHRGTLTTQAKNKFYNRKMELALRELEFAAELGEKNLPKEELDKIWKEVLLYQFHDIIPGSSIKRVYDESVARYIVLYDRVIKKTKEIYSDIADRSGSSVAFNSLPFERREIVKLNGESFTVTVPAMGYSSHFEPCTEFVLNAGENVISNEFIKVVFNQNGTISSVYDIVNRREVLESGSQGNLLNVYEDTGDCWDIPIEYMDKKPEIFELVSQRTYIDSCNAVCEQHYRYNKSELIQKTVLKSGSKRVDFVTEVDWNESHKMLRASFNVDILAEYASYEIQFGQIKRSTFANTSWEAAKFEVCAHKWADLSQNDYGVALLNDCKYGYRVSENILSITLLRSPNYPGKMADIGKHKFTYSLYPHMGNEIEGRVSEEAHMLNIPLTVIENSNISGNAYKSFISVNGQINTESVKKSEDGKDTVIRLYEPYGQRVRTDILFSRVYSKIISCDLLENESELIAENTDRIFVDVKPFEIITLRLIKETENEM